MTGECAQEKYRGGARAEAAVRSRGLDRAV